MMEVFYPWCEGGSTDPPVRGLKSSKYAWSCRESDHYVLNGNKYTTVCKLPACKNLGVKNDREPQQDTGGTWLLVPRFAVTKWELKDLRGLMEITNSSINTIQYIIYTFNVQVGGTCRSMHISIQQLQLTAK